MDGRVIIYLTQFSCELISAAITITIGKQWPIRLAFQTPTQPWKVPVQAIYLVLFAAGSNLVLVEVLFSLLEIRIVLQLKPFSMSGLMKDSL